MRSGVDGAIPVNLAEIGAAPEHSRDLGGAEAAACAVAAPAEGGRNTCGEIVNTDTFAAIRVEYLACELGDGDTLASHRLVE